MADACRQFRNDLLALAVMEGGSLIHDSVVRELLASVWGRMKELLTSHYMICAGQNPPFVSHSYAANKNISHPFLSRGTADMSVPQRVGRSGNFNGGNFRGNSGSTRTPDSGPPSAVSVGCGAPDPESVPGRQVIGIIGPTPATPAHDPSPGTLSISPHSGGFFGPVSHDAVPTDARPAGGSAGAETEPAGSVSGGGMVPTGSGGGGDSQEPAPPPTPAGGGQGSGPDLRPHLVGVGRGVSAGEARWSQHFGWSVVFCISCGLLVSLSIAMLCKCLSASEDKGRDGGGGLKKPAPRDKRGAGDL